MMEDKSFLFYDELFESLIQERLRFDSKGEPIGMLGLKNYGEKRVLWSGTHNQSLVDVLQALVPANSLKLHHEYASQAKMCGLGQS